MAVIVAAGIGFAASSAYTAGNTVPATNIGQYNHTIGPNDLKPAACASLTLNHLILGDTATGSGSDDDLVLGTWALTPSPRSLPSVPAAASSAGSERTT